MHYLIILLFSTQILSAEESILDSKTYGPCKKSINRLSRFIKSKRRKRRGLSRKYSCKKYYETMASQLNGLDYDGLEVLLNSLNNEDYPECSYSEKEFEGKTCLKNIKSMRKYPADLKLSYGDLDSFIDNNTKSFDRDNKIFERYLRNSKKSRKKFVDHINKLSKDLDGEVDPDTLTELKEFTTLFDDLNPKNILKDKKVVKFIQNELEGAKGLGLKDSFDYEFYAKYEMPIKKRLEYIHAYKQYQLGKFIEEKLKEDIEDSIESDTSGYSNSKLRKFVSDLHQLNGTTTRFKKSFDGNKFYKYKKLKKKTKGGGTWEEDGMYLKPVGRYPKSKFFTRATIDLEGLEKNHRRCQDMVKIDLMKYKKKEALVNSCKKAEDMYAQENANSTKNRSRGRMFYIPNLVPGAGGRAMNLP